MMPTCPNCGSYISPGTNVCSCGTTFGGSSEEIKERKPTEFEIQQEEKRKIRHGYSKKAKNLMEEGRYLEAIEYYDKLFEMSPSGYHLKAKAEAYYYAGMYEEAFHFFKESLKHIKGIDSYPIHVWIGDTLNELKRFDDAINFYERAEDIINKKYESSVNFFKGERWDGYERMERACAHALEERNERISGVEKRIEYSKKLKDEAASKEQASKRRFDKRTRSLMRHGKENMITITGTRFYGNLQFEPGMKLTLVRERDNKFDSCAIAVYFEDKVGYVANSDETCCHFTSKACDVRIPDIISAEYITYFDSRYHIARIMRDF